MSVLIGDGWCKLCEFDERDGGEEPCVGCTVCWDNKPTQFKPKKPPSNADRIRAMTDEELASLLMYFADDTDEIDEKDYDAFGAMEWRERMLRWLKQEVTDG